MSIRDFVISKVMRRILADPVYKSYYCYKITDKNDDTFLSPVMDHQNMMIYNKGLVVGRANRDIKFYELIASGLSEEDASDIYYVEQSDIDKDLED